MDKKDEEQHSMSKPKPLEEVSDGDLSEIKKDPIWKTWLIGKGLGALGEGKLNRKTKKPMKLKPRKITLDDYEHTNKPSYYQAVMEEEGKKKEKKKAYESWLVKRDDWDKKERSLDRKIRKKPKRSLHPSKDVKELHDNIDRMLAERKRAKIEEEEEQAEANISDANKADYFVEEIKANIIYHDKVFPLVGMIAGQVARGIGQAGKKVGGQLLQDVGDVSQGMMQESEEEEQ